MGFGKLNSMRAYERRNGFSSLLHYAKTNYLSHDVDRGLIWGLSSKKRNPRLIASLTSYPTRITTVSVAIKSLLAQTVKPDMIILWLSLEQFPGREGDLPADLLELRDFGLTIEWVEGDIRSHKKYVYALKRYPDDCIITFDDDLTYPSDTIEHLYASYLKHPKAVSACRCHLIHFEQDGSLAPYREWDMEYSGFVDEERMDLFSTSGAGTLYPPRCMHDEVIDVDAMSRTCPDADDVWLKIMQVLVDTPVVQVHPNRGLEYIPGTQEEALWHYNIDASGNDTQFAAAFKLYDQVLGDPGSICERMRTWQTCH